MDINALYCINEVKSRLMDEESIKVYDARVQYFLDRDELAFHHTIFSENTKIPSITKFDEFYEQFSENKNIVLFGAGIDGRIALNILKRSKYADFVVAFCDNNPDLWATTVESLPVITPSELVSNGEYLVIINSRKYAPLIFESLLWKNYPYSHIFYSQNRVLRGQIGKEHYFCLFEPSKGEVFIDAGCFGGETSLQFIKWCEGNYRHIYAFEPSETNYPKCVNTLKNIDNCQIFNKGLWSREDVLSFSDSAINTGGSKINKSGNTKTQVVNLDNVLNGKPATFIKMDIEGSELEALKGAKETIMRHHPRMSICLYHKPEDILEIPAYILTLNPDYKFYVRHYSTLMLDTILYAY